jgi:phosphoinositide-3-kinase regulatory subunit
VHRLSTSQPIEEAEWYWSNVGRDEVSWILQDADDGSFLVRDKTGFPGDYTLSLKKDGGIRMIRIFHHRGMYGFSEPLTFTSVIALVEYYKKNSLREYNSQLDICLLYPVSKYEDTSDRTLKIDEVMEELRLAEEEYDIKNNEFQKRSEKFSLQKSKEVQMENRRKAQEEIISMWRDQLALLSSNRSQAVTSESNVLAINIQQIDQRMRGATEKLSTHDKDAMMLEEETILLDKEMQEMKPRIYELEQIKAQHMSQLGRMGLKPDEIKRRLFAMKKANRDKEKENVMMMKRRASYVAEEEEEERLATDDVYFDIYGTTQDLIRDDDEDDKDWLITVDRKDSERLLAPCEDGVFLVRPRAGVSPADSHQFTLCIAFRGEVNHIKVLCESGAYGFTAGCCHLQSLRDLVRHYQTTSLHQHNPKLTISLTTPYNKWNRTRKGHYN